MPGPLAFDVADAIADVESPKIRRALSKRHEAEVRGAAEHYGLVESKNGDWKIRDKPPLVVHLDHDELHADQAFATYAATLHQDGRVLFRRYHCRDIAFKTVGVGSVGVFSAIGLSCPTTVHPCYCRSRRRRNLCSPRSRGRPITSTKGSA
jgi:hypothetical protein